MPDRSGSAQPDSVASRPTCEGPGPATPGIRGSETVSIDSGTAEPDRAGRASEPPIAADPCRGGADGIDGRIGHGSRNFARRARPEAA